jgi:hypothetical protein
MPIEEMIDYWHWFSNTDAKKHEPITGKYLFFSDDKQALIKLASKLLKKYNLPKAKVPDLDVRRSKSQEGFGFVLCVYDSEPKLKHELRQYANEKIHYRYWKSDADTSAGKYSEEFRKDHVTQPSK